MANEYLKILRLIVASSVLAIVIPGFCFLSLFFFEKKTKCWMMPLVTNTLVWIITVGDSCPD